MNVANGPDWVEHASRVLAMASSPLRTFIVLAITGKDCFGGTPKPARETRALTDTCRSARRSI